MTTFIAVLHILVALILIGLVLIQDSKGGGALGMGGGGGGSNSVLGATGASTLAAKMTRIAAIIFALTSIGLSVLSSQHSKSILDKLPAASAVPTAPATTTPETPAAAAPEAATAPAAPAESAPAANPTK